MIPCEKLEAAFIEAALNLAAQSEAHAFSVPVPNTTPRLIVALFEEGSTPPGVSAPHQVEQKVDAVRMLPISEQQYILSNPSAIMELMTYRSLQQDQADSMEAGTHGDHARYVELARLGQSIIDQDPECFSQELRDEYARALRYIELQDAAGKRIPADGEVRNG
jgi:hypothetical protein